MPVRFCIFEMLYYAYFTYIIYVILCDIILYYTNTIVYYEFLHVPNYSVIIFIIVIVSNDY